MTVEWFQYEKLGAKSVSLGYLELSHVFGGNHAPPGLGLGAGMGLFDQAAHNSFWIRCEHSSLRVIGCGQLLVLNPTWLEPPWRFTDSSQMLPPTGRYEKIPLYTEEKKQKFRIIVRICVFLRHIFFSLLPSLTVNIPPYYDKYSLWNLSKSKFWNSN